MSYPTKVNVLVVEDESTVKRYYEGLFEGFRSRFDIAPLKYAFTLEEAVEQLNRETIFHLVIVDLRNPESSGTPTSDQELLGLRVIEVCAKRENWPIPALLVFSGQMSGNLEHKLNGDLERQFSYGKARVKPETDGVISDALEHIASYSAVGIHELEKPDPVHPSLSPRERDLIRRSALQNQAIGVVLSYFTSDFARGEANDGFSGWTKVFVGRYLAEDYAPSSTSFFKFMPYKEAAVVTRDALTMQNCLPHVKVRFSESSGVRYLLVTEKVGSKDGLPSTFESLLGRKEDSAKDWIVKAVQQVASQLDRLGVSTPNRLRPPEILHLSAIRVGDKSASEAASDQIVQYRGRLTEEECSLPDRVLQRLLAVEEDFPIRMKKCHGDLNASNVAVDLDEDGASAYIFDASGMRSLTTEYDLAFVEVTTLLHLNAGEVANVDAFASFYGGETLQPTEDADTNAQIFIKSIRREALARCDERTYALLAFDIAFGQVWGLAFGGSANKVKRREDAVKLLFLVSGWVERLFFSDPGSWIATGADPGF